MKIDKFEDLECWQQARELTQQIYHLANNNALKKDFRLVNQITGASISIMNNIAEGFGSKSLAEFIRFLIYSRRSCCEAQNCLYIALDQKYIAQEDFQKLYCQIKRVRKIIDGLIRYLKKKRITEQRNNG